MQGMPQAHSYHCLDGVLYSLPEALEEVFMTELEKLLKGMIYDPSDEELATMRRFAHKICSRYNLLE